MSVSIGRRALLLAAPPALVGCLLVESDEIMTNPAAPWKMWGQKRIVTGLGGQFNEPQQLARVSYKRPDSWRFFLAAQIVNGPVLGAPASLTVYFDLAFGVGLTQFSTPERDNTSNFHYFRWTIAAGIDPVILPAKWTTQARGPLWDDSLTESSLTDVVVAQDIQAYASVAPSAAGEYQVACTAFFAPNTHVRPDWFSEQFSGAEKGGA